VDSVPSGILFSLLILMVILSAYFSGSETGIMSLNRYKLKHLANQGNKDAKRVERLLKRPDRLIGLILIGNNLVNILASAIATILGIRFFGDLGVAIATGGLTLIILIFAEVTPKTLASLYPSQISYSSSHVLQILMVILSPLVLFVNLLTNGLLKLFGIDIHADTGTHLNSDELRTVVNEAGGLIPKRHQNMLISILDLENVTVEDIMIPRNEIQAIDINNDWKSITRQLLHCPHSRLILYRDNIDEAVGILRIKEAYRLMMEKKKFTKQNMLKAADEIYFIPEGTPLNIQLLKFQRNNERSGLIVDEYGDIQGLVTLEDILEEIVGEFSTSSMVNNLAEEIIPQEDGGYIIDGSATIRDINKNLGWNLPTDGPITLNGLIVEKLEDIPESQFRMQLGSHPIEIVDVADNMIKSVRFLPSLRINKNKKKNI